MRLQATDLARQMVTKYGMSEVLGQVSIEYEDDGRSLSSETRSTVESEVHSGDACVGEAGARVLGSQPEGFGFPAFCGLPSWARSTTRSTPVHAAAAGPVVLEDTAQAVLIGQGRAYEHAQACKHVGSGVGSPTPTGVL